MDNLPASFNILVIEDNKNVCSLLETSLNIRGHKVTIISDGLQALNAVNTFNSFDIILLDIQLPRATGWEILANIRSKAETASLPVIMLTALDDEGSETKALYDGADDYIKKPFSIRVLLARINTNIRKKKNRWFKEDDLPFCDGNFEELSSREKEILGFIVKGYSTKDIAEKAFISDKTVMNHVKGIIKKLKVENRMQAAIVAIKYNLV